MGVPKRVTNQKGRYALVDGIPFELPVRSANSPVLMAAFSINPDKAKKLMPAEIHPFRLWNKGILLITVINYRSTVIGKYIEYSIAIACTHGTKRAPRLLPGILMSHYGMGQYVFDLPVSSEISVKGGKGIWGMPKHQGNLDFIIGDDTVSSQYDLEGKMVMKVEVKRPKKAWLPVSMNGVANFCEYRGMLMKSYIYFKGKLGFSLFSEDAAKLTIGSHPRIQPLKELEISSKPIFSCFFPETHGVLDDHFESWFLHYDEPPEKAPEGFESVINLSLSEEWLAPPTAKE